ncbi:MAG TPA: hypothetical protein VGG28_24185 [Kofleriaceae bacterium]
MIREARVSPSPFGTEHLLSRHDTREQLAVQPLVRPLQERSGLSGRTEQAHVRLRQDRNELDQRIRRPPEDPDEPCGVFGAADHLGMKRCMHERRPTVGTQPVGDRVREPFERQRVERGERKHDVRDFAAARAYGARSHGSVELIVEHDAHRAKPVGHVAEVRAQLECLHDLARVSLGEHGGRARELEGHRILRKPSDEDRFDRFCLHAPPCA